MAVLLLAMVSALSMAFCSCSVPPPSERTSLTVEIAERNRIQKAVLAAAKPCARARGPRAECGVMDTHIFHRVEGKPGGGCQAKIRHATSTTVRQSRIL